MKKNKLIVPFVKWVGGKRQLLPEILKQIPLPRSYNNYFEPFIGGGAVLFHLQPKLAVINDMNEELINLYTVIREDVDSLITELKKHKNETEYFYRIRNWDRDKSYQSRSTVVRAARIHYLNKTCYNGLFRVNSSGEFNAPFGRYKNPNIVNEITLKAVSKFLNENDVTILNKDYEEALSGSKKNDFVYLDPPYDPLSDSSNFTGYNKGGFGKEEQERLKLVCDNLDAKGIKFLLSNSSTEFIHTLYSRYTKSVVFAKRSVNSLGNKRGEVKELLIRNYE